jgi:uncharacterized protein YxjI
VGPGSSRSRPPLYYTARRGGTVVATVSKAYLTMRDTYAVDIAPGEDELLILTAVLALDLAEDRERRDRT